MNPGGNAIVIAIGAAAPVKTPLIGPPVPFRELKQSAVSTRAASTGHCPLTFLRNQFPSCESITSYKPGLKFLAWAEGEFMPTITVKDGTQIFYTDWGKGQPIVFSHGWPLSGEDWENQMLFFGQR